MVVDPGNFLLQNICLCPDLLLSQRKNWIKSIFPVPVSSALGIIPMAGIFIFRFSLIFPHNLTYMRPFLFTLTAVLFLTACKNKKDSTLSAFKAIDVKYPTTKKDTTVKDNYFGTEVADPYRWLENDSSAETAEWVKAQNEVTNGFLAQIPFRDKIRKRYEELYNYEKYSAPFKEGKFTYYYKNSGLQNQSVLYREPAERSEPEVFLDPNAFSKDGTTSLATINFSRDGSMAAYNISEGGSDWQKLIVMNALTKELTGDTLEIKFGAASWKGNDGFYYSTYDKVKNGSRLSGITESHKVYYHKVGTAQKDDQLIFGSDEKPFRMSGRVVSEDQQWLFLYTAIETYGNGLYIQNLSAPGAPIKPVITEMKNRYGVVYNDAAFFYIQTDKDAPTGKVLALPVANPDIANAKLIIDAKPEVLTASSAGSYIFCSYLKDAVTKVSQHDTSGKLVREIELPGPGTAAWFLCETGGERDLFYFRIVHNPCYNL